MSTAFVVFLGRGGERRGLHDSFHCRPVFFPWAKTQTVKNYCNNENGRHRCKMWENCWTVSIVLEGIIVRNFSARADAVIMATDQEGRKSGLLRPSWLLTNALPFSKDMSRPTTTAAGLPEPGRPEPGLPGSDFQAGNPIAVEQTREWPSIVGTRATKMARYLSGPPVKYWLTLSRDFGRMSKVVRKHETVYKASLSSLVRIESLETW